MGPSKTKFILAASSYYLNESYFGGGPPILNHHQLQGFFSGFRSAKLAVRKSIESPNLPRISGWEKSVLVLNNKASPTFAQT